MLSGGGMLSYEKSSQSISTTQSSCPVPDSTSDIRGHCLGPGVGIRVHIPRAYYDGGSHLIDTDVFVRHTGFYWSCGRPGSRSRRGGIAGIERVVRLVCVCNCCNDHHSQTHDFRLYSLRDESSRQSQSVGPQEVILATRMSEMLVESVPQVIVQLGVLTNTPVDEWTSLQVIAISCSVLAIGWMGAMADKDLDTAPAYRQCEPSLYGIYPSSVRGRVIVFASSAVFIASSTLGRAFAVCSLASVSASLLGCWLAVECCVYVGVAVAQKRVSFFRHGVSVFGGLAMQVAFGWLGCTMAPILYLRVPFLATPAVYSLCVVYTVLANFGMVAAANVISEDINILLSTSLLVVGAAAVTALLGFSVMYWTIPSQYRKTFTMNTSPSKHLRYVLWNQKQYTSDYGTSQDALRTNMLRQFRHEYWPHDLVREWIDTNWSEWNTQQEEPRFLPVLKEALQRGGYDLP